MLFGVVVIVVVFYLIWLFYFELIDLVIEVEVGCIDDDEVVFVIL